MQKVSVCFLKYSQIVCVNDYAEKSGFEDSTKYEEACGSFRYYVWGSACV